MKTNVIVVCAAVAVVSAFVGVAVYRMFTDNEQILEERKEFIGIFDEIHVKELIEKDGISGIRFYNALESGDGKQSIVSVGVDVDQCDIALSQEGSYFRAGNLRGSSALVTKIDADALRADRSNLDKEKFPKFSLTLSNENLKGLLETQNGIGLCHGLTVDGRPTFAVYSGNISDGKFLPSSKPLSVKIEPCPIACPTPPVSIYSCHLD